MKVELVHDIASVCVHCVDAQVENVRNILAAFALRNQLQDFPFAWG